MTVLILTLLLATYYFWPNSESKNIASNVSQDFERQTNNNLKKEFEKESITAAVETPKIVSASDRQQPRQPSSDKPRDIQSTATSQEIALSRENPPAGEILFEVKGNLAIAFGDIIAGRIGSEFKHKYGRFEPTPTQFWPDGVVPYIIHEDVSNPADVIAVLEYFNSKTPVKFVPQTNEVDAVIFMPGDAHCYSHLGKVGGLQPIYLSKDCGKSEITHEVMHSLGFIHEHSRTDRDQFVSVHWDNIETQYYPQFYVAPDAYMKNFYHTHFDFNSVMIYRPDAFAKSPEKPSLSPHNNSDTIEPTGSGLSQGDLNKLFDIYRN